MRASPERDFPAFFGNMDHFSSMVFFPDMLAFLEGLGAGEMMLVFIVVLVLFGGQKLPEFARGLGKSMREFKKAAAGVEEEFKRAMEDDERKRHTAALPAPAAPEAPVPYNDNLPPEALAPGDVPADAPAPSIESIPAPPLIPLGAATAEAPAETTEMPASDAVPPEPVAPATPAPAAPVGNRSRDDYS
jgi:sec-independent protein translocase protein TatA